MKNLVIVLFCITFLVLLTLLAIKGIMAAWHVSHALGIMSAILAVAVVTDVVQKSK